MNLPSSAPLTAETGFSDREIREFESWVMHFSGRSGIGMRMDSNLDAPAAINLKDLAHPEILLNPRLIIEKFGYSPDLLAFYLFHEIQHLVEESELRATEAGRKVYAERQARLENRKHLMSEFHHLENALRDVWVDAGVIAPENAPALRATVEKDYRENCFPKTDLTPFPLHRQFSYALLREAMLPKEPCTVDPRVRREIRILRMSGAFGKTVE